MREDTSRRAHTHSSMLTGCKLPFRVEFHSVGDLFGIGCAFRDPYEDQGECWGVPEHEMERRGRDCAFSFQRFAAPGTEGCRVHLVLERFANHHRTDCGSDRLGTC